MSDSPFANPLLRYGIGLSGAVVIAFVALFFLEGATRWIALGIAALDAVVTPMVLKRAAT
ncbi:hypothetical protein [Candidatus Halobonum tyrrellensis]|uniref:Uncharacterized protein n=1 Tax=Candidatus Halobonum tyrrellensis G22 TaxID=1324957 RepID=V4HJ41_9EURY|nr:hypothetical protein [Candidatus Halobonum tyrrellensis]ESP87934.1 hypothetical protein K933_11476 [Candidatus Halobonum tyrrellensis G22]